jgi:phage terminase small subunit
VAVAGQVNMNERSFTDRQARFIAFYEGNGVETARKAGYTGTYSTLGKTAHDLLKIPKIVQAIRERETRKLFKFFLFEHAYGMILGR